MTTIIDQSLMPRRTVWGAMVQTAAYTRVPMSYIEKTTLNEKYNFFTDTPVGSNEFPDLGYFAIGRGSTYTKILADSSSEPRNFLHEPVDAALYYQQPFVLRTVDNDLTPAQRVGLGGRCYINHNGQDYIAYYLKKLTKSSSIIEAVSVTPSTPTDIVVPLTGDDRYLNPTPIEPTPGNIRTDGTYCKVNCTLEAKLSAWDIDEILNAKQILTGSSQLDITEIGLFSAIPKTVVDNTTGEPVSYEEAIRTQLNSITPCRILLNQRIGQDLTLEHNLAISDPTNFNFVF